MSYLSTFRVTVTPQQHGTADQQDGRETITETGCNSPGQNVMKGCGESPVFCQPLTDCCVDEGNSIILQAMIRGSPPMSVRWLHNGEPVLFGTRTFRGGIARLIVKECLPEDAGVYTCMAKNGVGKASSSAAVIVSDLEAIYKRKSLIAPVGNTNCTKATNVRKTELGYSCQGREGSNTVFTDSTKTTNESVSAGDNSPIFLECSKTVNGRNPGLYHSSQSSGEESPVFVSNINGGGDKLSKNGFSPVPTLPGSAVPKKKLSSKSGSPPKLLNPQAHVEVKVGENAVLRCEILGTPPIAVSWLKQKKQVACDPKTTVETTESKSILTIKEAQADDSGCYTFIVRDRLGSAQHQINLSVVDKPQPPSGKPYVSQLRKDSLTLSWSGPCYDGGTAVQSYIVEVQRSNESEWKVLTHSCLSTSYRVKNNLEPDGSYRFRIRAVNPQGCSEPSQESDTIKMAESEDEKEEFLEHGCVTINTKDKFSDFYIQLEKLGVGKFGQVYKVQEKSTSKIRAAKICKTRLTKDRQAVRQEVEVMNCLHHPKLVQCISAFESRMEFVMVMEYVAGGELFERIVDDNFEHTEPTSVQYMQQLLEGVKYIHQQGIVHLDLKPENIMCVNRTGTLIKIIDFGLARKLDSKTSLKVLQGTPEFVAPEVIGFEPVCFTTDMWSVGVICYILLSGESPFQGNNEAETLSLVTAAQWEFDDETFAEISDSAKDFIQNLLNKDPRRRLSSEQAYQHAWLKVKDQGASKALSKERMKKYLARQKWQKTGKAMLALKRMALLSSRTAACASPTDIPENEEELMSLEEQLQSKPYFSKLVADLEATEGSTACLQCQIQGYPDAEVLWYHNDIPIIESPRLQIEYIEDGSCLLKIVDVCLKDSGLYTCEANNSEGKATCSASLNVVRADGNQAG
ncbi:myosin light chain kinase, smooth muscle-like [Protopterus annectens]|uniref:myosin light chain kinase, smooth muscle-like n=1 Tax=Protopterus annectens TaxID=7888 RepID=UPI001CFAFA6F|nr:myosin light chain kinase, smooth muscle-like [Protopterus annectens]